MNLLIFFSLIFHSFIITSAKSKCQKSFHCGNFTMEFPFSNIKDPSCGLNGLILVDDCDSDSPKIIPGDGRFNSSYLIRNMLPPNKLIIINPQIQNQLDNKHCQFVTNVSLSRSPSLSFTYSGRNLTLFACYNQSRSELIEKQFHSYSRKECEVAGVYYKTPATDVPSAAEAFSAGCIIMQLPIKSNRDTGDLFDLLAPEFTIEWSVSENCAKCYNRGGQCLTNSRNEFQCKEKGDGLLKLIFMIGGVTVTALTSTFLILILLIRRKHTLLRLFGFLRAKTENEKDIELFLKNYGNLAPMRYNYYDIKKMTKSFSKDLGKGGYGSVYKGTLPDGRLVAVKILNESKGNGEEFMNEVASISRTSHINIVNLLGFCFEGSRRALIYDFMPNGSLEKFIQNTSSEGGLGWQKLLEITLGIARGLEYLHQGCNTRILHFDIKPHNILLDKDFNPRISDFGLAKLCPNRSSMVSMLVARGTIGYIAPEVFLRNFGEVSHKSDVYSYGMMVLEIAGRRKNVDRADVDRTSEIYFPHYIYKQLKMDAESDSSLAGIMDEDENQFAKRKLAIVGLWCIQTDPRDRPSMTKVIEMLEGEIESLQVPPKPYLSSPPRPVPEFSISESVYLSTPPKSAPEFSISESV